MNLAHNFQGIAFAEYIDAASTDIAVEGLNGMELINKHLKVQRASIGLTQASGLEMSVNAMSMLAGTTSTDLENGRVLQLLNMVTAEELIDNEDYEGKSSLHGVLICANKLKKSARMSRKSAASSAKFWT